MLIKVYKDSAIEATKLLRKNWLILPGTIGLFVAFTIVAILGSQLGYAGGFLIGMVSLVLLGVYYSWIRESVFHGKLTTSDLIRFDYPMFSAFLSVAFILFLINISFSLFGSSGQMAALSGILNLVLFIILSAVPEVLYAKGSEGVAAMKDSLDFVQQYWIEWFIPLLIILSPIIIVKPTAVLGLFSSGDPLVPVLVIVRAASELPYPYPVCALIGLVFGTWFMFFRGALFLKLEAGANRGFKRHQ